MKKLVVFILLLFEISVYAQFRRPGRGIYQSQTPQQNEFSFSPEQAIGVVYYDVKKTTKKIDLKNRKKSKKAFEVFTKSLSKFNKDMKDLVRIYGFILNQQKQQVESARELAVESRDVKIYQDALKQASEAFKPIVEEIKEKEKAMDSVIKPLMTEDQFKSWVKFREKQKKKAS